MFAALDFILLLLYSKNNNNMYNKPYVIRYIKNYRRRIE